jgi:hypothetical protein
MFQFLQQVFIQVLETRGSRQHCRFALSVLPLCGFVLWTEESTQQSQLRGNPS